MNHRSGAETVRDSIVRFIRQDGPGWIPDGYICRDDLDMYQAKFVNEVLNSGIADTDSIEAMVTKSIVDQEMVSRNVNEEFEIHVLRSKAYPERTGSSASSGQGSLA